MNQKCTLKTLLYISVLITKRAISLLGILCLLAPSALAYANNNIKPKSFPIKTVQAFNQKVKKDLSNAQYKPIAVAIENVTSAPCPNQSGVIGGKVFQDFNYNGIDDQIGAGLEGIEVHLYGCDAAGVSQASGISTTDADGNYFFTNLTDGKTYRIEFVIPASKSFLSTGFNGADSRTSVQFVTSPSCNAGLGLVNPADYCEEDPSLAIPCFVNGDPLASGSGSADEEALVLFKKSYENNKPKPTKLSVASEIGSTWGITYQKSSRRVFVSAFLKRHVGLGPLGLGGIYQVDLSGVRPVTTPFIDVNSIGINVGTYASNGARGLTANINLPSNDSQAFTDVGKRGIGGMCMSDDGTKLYLINLTEKKLHAIDLSTGTPTSNDVQTYNLPNPNCSGGAFRPFSVKMSEGNIYVGGVCDAEASGNKSDLRALVYRLDGSNFTEVLNFSLDYIKGKASRTCDDFRGWFPWMNQLPEVCFNEVIVYPTPQLTALEFDAAGDMILGFTDRSGNQLGFLNYPPNGTSQTYSVFTGGDILKAGKTNNGTYEIEQNGAAGNYSTAGANNGEGPGGGEFYFWDVYDIAPGVPRPHSETAQGGLALVKGSGEVISTALDPFGTTVNSGGVNYFNNQTGAVRDPGYRVFRSGASSPATFSKANGLGDLVALCGEAPIEIGGRLWVDANENGVQDPCEIAFSGVKVALYDKDGKQTGQVETDINGEYYFNGNGLSSAAILPNESYYVVIGYQDQVDPSTNILLDSFLLTTANQGMGIRPDLNDSDGVIAGNNILSSTLSGYPIIEVQTGGIGMVSHDNDAGFVVRAPVPKGNITGFVWNDLNENGLQNNGEPAIIGVAVTLYRANNTEIASTNTDNNGKYIFENVEGDEYYLVFDASDDPVAGDNFSVTLQDVGSDDNLDSDINQNTARVDFQFEPENGDVEFDAGYTLPVSQIIGTVFNDEDQNGLQGNNEPMIEGVTVMLFSADGTVLATTQTDANGNYIFDEVMQGDYYIMVDVSTNTQGVSNFKGTTQDVGDDDFDSDVDPNSGKSDTFNHNPANGNTDRDAGFYEPNGAISGYVWYDLNENGLQNAGEVGIAGVEVQLLDENGNVLKTTQTDANGNYEFLDIKTANYSLVFDASDDPVAGDNYEVTLQDIGSDDNFDSDINPATKDVAFAFSAIQGNAEYDAGYTLPLASLRGLAFDDLDRNGLQGNNEPMIGGVTVTLFHENNTELKTTTTDANGNYAFNEIMAGNYYIAFDVSTNTAGISNYVGTIQDAGDDDFDSDVNPNSGRTNTFNFNPNDGDGIYDAGFYVGTGKITGLAFNDINEDGLQDSNEPGISGVEVVVVGTDGAVIKSAMTRADGTYEINDVPPGTMQVIFDPTNDLNTYTVTQKDVNANQSDELDSDIDSNKESDAFNFDPLIGADIDGGFFIPVDPVMIGDFVFKDCNENGIQDADETGIPNISVSLTGTNYLGEAVNMQVSTNSMGKYTFTVPRPGTYVLDFDIPTEITGLAFSPKDRGGSEALDSDINPISGTTDPITIESGMTNLDIDAGIIDNAPPLIFNVPPDVTVDCQDIPNPPSSVKGVDNCDPSIPVTFSQRIINEGSCPYIIERTWTAADDCGNATTRTQRITVTDTEAPVITIANPILATIPNNGEVIFDCDNMPEFTAEDVTAIDNCSDVEVKFVDLVREQGDCLEDGYLVKMICGWIAEDDCGNRSEYNIVIFVVDTKSPTLTNIPEDVTINLDQGEFIPPVAGTVTATDNCDEYVRIEFDETTNLGVCGSEIIRTWIGYDDCGNKTVESQKLTLLEDCSCPDELVSSTLVWDAACDGSMLGMITLDLTADINKYDISISPNVGTLNFAGNIFSDLPAGDYTVTVKYDALEDCVETYDFRVNVATPATIEVVAQTDADCFSANGTVTLSPADYVYEWSDDGTGAQRNDLAAGEYIVTFTDENQCKGSQAIIIRNPDGCECIDFKVNVSNELSPTCNETADGKIETMLSGGDAPYTFLWHNGQTTSDLVNATGGNYALTVTDVNGCEATLAGTLAAPASISIVETLMNGQCGEKGAIDIFVNGGIPPYTYAWSNDATTEDLTNLVTGTYTVTVTDANDCTANLTLDISNSGDISVALSSKAPTCAASDNGSIQATVTGGNLPLSYEWSNGATTSSIDNVAAGIYAVMVTDATGCKAMAEINLDAPSAMTVNIITADPICGATTGNVSLEVDGGTAPYTYEWSNGATTKDLNNVTLGDYTVIITDANGCTNEASASVNIYTPIEASVTAMHPNCNGENGSITLNVNGGTAPYTYAWSNNTMAKDLMNIPPGNYTVSITDANGCMTTASADVESIAGLQIENTISHPTCANEASGAIDITITGGQSPYIYAWSNGATTENLSNLMPGGYTLTVTDANGCIITSTLVLETPTALAATLTPTYPICFGEVGSIDVEVSGGTAPYTYLWDFDATTQNVAGLIAGDYSLTVTDANGCYVSQTATISVPSAIEGTAIASSPNCDGEGGRIDLSISGGTAPYTYEWSNGATTEDLNDIAPGSYNVTITDANACTGIVSSAVESISGLHITEIIINPSCHAEGNGRIDINVTGGKAPYQYTWSNGVTTENLANLMAGTYSIIVIDANGCEITANYTLTAPAAIEAITEIDQPECNGETGKVNVTVSGGMTPYIFEWSNGATTEDLEDVAVGIYSLTITDANACSRIITTEIIEPSALIATVEVSDQDCSGDGAIDLTVSGGTAPYNYLWSNGATTEDMDKVGGGTYTVIISDANDCKLTQEVTVHSTGGIEIFLTGNEPTCPGASNGSLRIDVKGGTLPYSYKWSDGSAAVGLSHIPAGTYGVTVTDAKGCSLSSTATLEDAPEISATINATNPACAAETGSIDLIASGGTGILTYAWSNGATTEDLNNLSAGTYTVTITDGNACTQIISTTITIPTPLEVQAVATNPDCDGTSGNVNLSVLGGTAPYTYSWSNGSFEKDLLGVPAGSYTVTIADANACTATATATIESIDGISVTVENTGNPSCSGGTDGFIQLSISGGSAPYTINWSNGATTEAIENLVAGFYAATITDARDCKLIIDALLENPAAVNIESNIINPVCPGGLGSIQLTVTGGTAPYTYEWNNGAASKDVDNLSPGTYQVKVIDTNGCEETTDNIIIESPEDFKITLNPEDVKCYNESSGAIHLSTSITGNFTYTWSNGATTKDLTGIATGTYGVTVTNANGCQKTAETVINMPPALNLGMIFSDPQCPDDLGAINIEVSGGTVPYTYAWSNGATTEDIANLPAGTYTVIITDGNACTIQATAQIQAVEPISSTITTEGESCALNDGRIDMTVSGGTMPYTYAWSNGATSASQTDLAAGTYLVTITDAKGCTSTETALIADNCVCPSPLVNTNTVTNARCGEANGNIKIIVNGDLEHYQFQWMPDLGTTSGAYDNERTDLPAGNYFVMVTFANKPECMEKLSLAVGNKDGKTGEIKSVYPAQCDENNGQVILEPGVTYFWPDGSQSQNRSGLAPGMYELRVTDDSGCESFLTVEVPHEPCVVVCDLKINLKKATAPDCEGNLGKIDIAISGGTAPYIYEWSNGSTEEDLTNLSEGTYIVTVTDANDCTFKATVTLNKPDCSTNTCNIVLSLRANDLTCDGSNDGRIGVNVYNGTAPYTYKWSNGETTKDIENLAAGEYWVEVIDAEGCRAIAEIKVKSPGALIITETRTVIDCEKVEIKLNVTGGRAPYTWTCEDQSGSMLNPLDFAPGTYNCVITDGSGCSVEHTLVIEDYQPLDVIGVVTHASCGKEDGSIDLTPTGGTGPYTFEWDCGLYGDEDQFNLGPHAYKVTVTDASDCITIDSFVVEDCGGAAFGFIAVTATSVGTQRVKVDWETQNEAMIGNYIVLHSTDGESFDVIGLTMEGKGPIESATYTMEEFAKLGKNYYQIKYIDDNGNEFLSEIIDVVVAIPGSQSKSSIPAIIYPNPTQEAFMLDFASPLETKVEVTITDIDGVILEQIILEPGVSKQEFNVTEYESGVYNVTLQQRRKKLMTYRLVKAVE